MLAKIREKYFARFYDPFYSVLLIAILSAYYFGITGSAWAVTGEFTRWGGEFLELFGLKPKEWEYFQIIGLNGNIFSRKDGVMILGMFLGALISTLFAGHFKIRFPKTKRIIQALVGGIIAGFGARLGMGCNLASFFTGIPQFSLHAWFFTLMSIAGVYLGIFVISKQKSEFTLKKGLYQQEKKKDRKNLSFMIGLLVLICSIFWAIFEIKQGKHNVLGISIIFGLAFGFIISRAQICFTSAFRDLFLTGRGIMAKAIIIGMILSTIGVFGYIMLGVPPKIVWAGPNVFIGGFLFGFGIVIAGGCECGWMYRAMEGQIHYVFVGIGNVIGSMILAGTWSLYSQPLAKSFPKINLLESFENYGGLFVNLLFLILFLLLIIFIEYRVQKKISKRLTSHLTKDLYANKTKL